MKLDQGSQEEIMNILSDCNETNEGINKHDFEERLKKFEFKVEPDGTIELIRNKDYYKEKPKVGVKKCDCCGGTKLGELSLHDDQEGMLTCKKCKNRMPRWI